MLRSAKSVFFLATALMAAATAVLVVVTVMTGSPADGGMGLSPAGLAGRCVSPLQSDGWDQCPAGYDRGLESVASAQTRSAG